MEHALRLEKQARLGRAVDVWTAEFVLFDLPTNGAFCSRPFSSSLEPKRCRTRMRTTKSTKRIPSWTHGDVCAMRLSPNVFVRPARREVAPQGVGKVRAGKGDAQVGGATLAMPHCPPAQQPEFPSAVIRTA